MFTLENLVTYSLEADFSNVLSTKEAKTDLEKEQLKTRATNQRAKGV